MGKAAKRPSIRSFVDTETLRENVLNPTPEELRQEALRNRETAGSVTEARAARSRRLTVMQQMGMDLMHIDELEPHPDNFFSLDPEEIDNLAATIMETGRVNPIIYRTRPSGMKNQIIGGERRWHALRRIVEITGDEDWAMAPVQNLGPLSDEEAMFHLVSDNLPNRVLSPSEYARCIDVAGERIAKRRKQNPEFAEKHKGKKTRDIVAEMFKLSPMTVTRMQSINRNLTNEGKKLLDQKVITREQALGISRLPEEEQEEVTQKIIEEGYEEKAIDKIITEAEKSKDHSARKGKTVNDLLENAQKTLKKATKLEGTPDRVMLAQVQVYLMELEEKLNQADKS